MKKIYILLFMTLCTLSMNAETSMFYNLPEGAFVSGMTSTAAISSASVYLPYSPTEYIWTSTTGSGDWYLNDKKQKTTEAFSQSYQPGYVYYIPVLKQEGYTDYQYGNGGTAANMHVYGGTASVVYMTPAKLWCDKVQASSGQAQSMLANYKTTTNDVMGVFFNNKDIMYIDGISIPVNSNTSGQTVDDLFPNEGSHIIVNIYPATIIKGDDGKYTNTADRTSPLWTGTLTKTNFSVNSSSSYRGGVNVTFDIPISVSGPFCVELSDMKNSGCAFYIYSAKERTGCNFFGYYLKDGVETYPNPYTLAVSVHAMFPALYKDDASVEELVLPGKGGDVSAVIHSNVDPKAGEGFSIVVPDWLNYEVSYEDTKFSLSKKNTITFTAEANEGEEREGDITITNRGKVITYHIIQSAKGEDIIPLESVTLNTTSYILKKGYKYTLVATLTPSNATDNEITWTSSNESVVTVDNVDGTDPAGTIHYKGDGIATITATVGDKTATCVVKAVSGVKLNITSAKWATLGLDYPVNIPSGVVAYKASVDGTTVSLTEITGGKIPANEGVILYADEPDEYNFTVAGNLSPFTDNALKAAIETYNYTADENVYYLGLDGEKVVFKHLTSGSIAAGKAYLLAPKASEAKLDVVVEGTPTGITEVVPMAVKNDGIYNIQGVRVNNSFKGVVIMNGKKYLKK